MSWRAAPSAPARIDLVTRYTLVVIGSGPPGQEAALAAAKIGRAVVIGERSSDVAGGCIYAGTIPSKTKSATSYRPRRLATPPSATRLWGASKVSALDGLNRC